MAKAHKVRSKRIHPVKAKKPTKHHVAKAHRTKRSHGKIVSWERHTL